MKRSAQCHQSGQVLLILLLLIATGLTVGLLAVSRSTVDTQLSTKIERESKVFSANEAIVEDILKTPMTDDTKITAINDVNVTATKVKLEQDKPFEFPISEPIPVGETQTIWLIGHDPTSPYAVDETSNKYSGSTIDICWDGTTSNPKIPGLVTMLLYKDTTLNEYKVNYGAYVNGASAGSCGTNEQLTNDPNNQPNCFSNVSAKSVNNCGISTGTYKQSISIPSGTTPISIRVRPVFAPLSKLAVQPSGGATISPQAITDANVFAQHSGSGESSKIRIFRSYPAPPAIFDYVLFSGTNL